MGGPRDPQGGPGGPREAQGGPEGVKIGKNVVNSSRIGLLAPPGGTGPEQRSGESGELQAETKVLNKHRDSGPRYSQGLGFQDIYYADAFTSPLTNDGPGSSWRCCSGVAACHVGWGPPKLAGWNLGFRV